MVFSIIIAICLFLLYYNYTRNNKIQENKTDSLSQISEPIFSKNYPIVLHTNRVDDNVKIIKNQNRFDKGLMENYFFDYTNSYLKGIIFNDVTLDINSKIIKPDFLVISSKKSKLYCIEIDEPYTIDSNQNLFPIHFIGSDEDRNNYLLKNGVSIIRFAEEQIAKYPLECMSFISNLIEKEEHLDISKVNCWTKQQSFEMIKTCYRDSYLPQPLNNIAKTNTNNSMRSFGISNVSFHIVKDEVYYKLALYKGLEPSQDDYLVEPNQCWIKEVDLIRNFKQTILWKEYEKYYGQKSYRALSFLLSIRYFRIEAIGSVNQKYFNINNEFKLICTKENLDKFIIHCEEQSKSIKKIVGAYFPKDNSI